MERLFGAIPSVLKDLGHDQGAEEALVFAAWKDCAGGLIAERTETLEFFEKRLIVAVQDATWRKHLEDLSPQMIAKLNAAVGQGTVKFIEFRIDPAVFANREPKSEAAKAEEERSVPASLAQAAERIGDEDLRSRFLDAAAVYLSKE